MQHTNEETNTQTTKTGPAPVKHVDWVALQQELTPSDYKALRLRKPLSDALPWKHLKEDENKTRSPIYRQLIPRGWHQRTQNLRNIIKFIKEETQKPNAQVSVEVKENGICTLIFLERLPETSLNDTKMYFRVCSVEGKQGPWDTTGTDLGDLRTSSFYTIVNTMLNGCKFEVPKALFPDGLPPGLLVQAELLFGTKTSHITVTQMIFKIQNIRNAQEKMEVFKSFTLKIFGVSLYSKNDSLFDEGKSTVGLLSLFTVHQILTYWEKEVRYTPSFAAGTIWNLHRVPQMFFQDGFTPEDEEAFMEFYTEHCNTGARNGKEGFIIKHMSENGDFTLWKVKPVYQKNEANFFVTAPNNALLLLMPHGATKNCMPLGFICAPPLNASENRYYGREIAATFFEPVTDPERGDFGVVFKGGGTWNGIEDLLRIHKKLIESEPDCLYDVQYGIVQYGYRPVKYKFGFDQIECTCLVREAHTRDFVIKALDLNFLTNDDDQKIVAAFRVNQVVPQRNSPQGMLYVLDTHVFTGIITREHLLDDTKSVKEDFERLHSPEKDLSFIEKCEYTRIFPNFPHAADAWEDKLFDEFIEDNITLLTPGMSLDSIKSPCKVLKYYQVLSAAMKDKHGLPPSARYTVPTLKTTESVAFLTARQFFGDDIDLIQECKCSTAKKAGEMVKLLEENKEGRKLNTEEETSLNNFLVSVRKSWTRNLPSSAKSASASAVTPAPEPEASKQEQTVPQKLDMSASTLQAESPQAGDVTQVGEVLHTQITTPCQTIAVIEDLEIGMGEPIEIPRNRLLAINFWHERVKGKTLDPILLFAYKLDTDENILSLVKQSMEEYKKRSLDKSSTEQNTDHSLENESLAKRAKID